MTSMSGSSSKNRQIFAMLPNKRIQPTAAFVAAEVRAVETV